MPILLRRGAGLVDRRDLGRLIIGIRRATIVVVLLLGFAYFRLAGESLALVSIGLISFAAVAQFAPAIFGGLYWRGATGVGAIWGLAAGFAVWAYTLPLPSLVGTGFVPASFVEDGPFGIGVLAPHALFGLDGLDEVSHSMLWSMLVNVGLFVGLSLTGRRKSAEHVQASTFVDVFTPLGGGADTRAVARNGVRPRAPGTPGTLPGTRRCAGSLRVVRRPHREPTSRPTAGADADLVHHVETLLTGAVGSASARFMVASVVDEEPLAVSEVVQILDETSQVLAYSRALERKSGQLEVATAELREANSRLQELDRLKDDFVSTITHELRTPLTSIRAFSEILMDNPDLEPGERAGYLRIVVDETARLTRLINQVLDLSKLESGGAEWQIEHVDLGQVLTTSMQATAQIFRDRRVVLEMEVPEPAPVVRADEDRLVQVMLNLLSNAVKFCPPGSGRVRIVVEPRDGVVRVDVSDNGPGIADEDQDVIFEKFRQGGDTRTNRPSGTGLGLPISRQIVDHLGGRLWVESTPGQGATFSFELPVAAVGSSPVPAERDS